MSSSWYFTKDGRKRIGPFTSEQLLQLAKDGSLNPSDMILKEGGRKWARAGEVKGLFPVPSQERFALEGREPEPSRPIRHRTLLLAVAVVGGLVLLLLVPAVLLALDRQTRAALGDTLLLVAVAGGGVGLFLVYRGFRAACPGCKKWWAAVFIDRQVIEKKKCYGLVTRTAYSSSSGSINATSHHIGQADYQDISGRTSSSGSTSWQERVPVIRTTYELRYECKYCQGRWTKTRVVEEEDFDIERK